MSENRKKEFEKAINVMKNFGISSKEITKITCSNDVKYKIWVPIYQCELNIIISNDIVAIGKKYSLENVEGCKAYVFRKTNKKDVVKYFLVCEPKVSKTTLVHETVHLVNYIFSDRGIELDRYNDENQAYFTGWLFKKIYKKIKKSKINY